MVFWRSELSIRCRLWIRAAVAVALGSGAAIEATATTPRNAPPLDNLDGPVHALAVYGGRLYAGGNFANVGTRRAKNLAAWDGATWTTFPEVNGPVLAMIEFGGDLILGGHFTMAGTTAVQHIARWNGTDFSPLGSGTDGPVRALLVQAGIILYVGGSFTSAGGVEAHSVARYVGNTWSGLGNGLEGDVHALSFYGPSLTAGGDFYTRDGTVFDRNVAIWAGGRWLPIANGVNGTVHAMVEYEDGLVIGGDFRQADWVTPARHIARLVGFGENWSSISFGFGTGDTLDTESVRCLYVDGTRLVAGGTFTLADLRSANRVARFDGRKWDALGLGMEAPVLAVTRFDGLLHAGGEFSTAGGFPASGIAAFDDVEWGPLVPVPVGLSDFVVEATSGGSHLRWTLSPGTRAATTGVGVQQAATGPGPYRELAHLVPELSMSFDDTSVEPGERVWYRLALYAADGTAEFSESRFIAIPEWGGRTRLHAPYVSSGTQVIGYDLGSGARVDLAIYDVAGRQVRQLESGWRAPGTYVCSWDGHDGLGRPASSGVYFLHLRTGSAGASRKFVVVAP